MGTANPALAQMMARQLIGKLAGGAGGGSSASSGGPMPSQPGMTGQAGGPGLGAGDSGADPNSPPTVPAGLQLSQQLAELQGADPDAMVKSLASQKSMAVQLYTRAAFTMPGVSRNLANVVKYLDSAIQEAEKAAATTSAAGPIANNAAIPNPAGQQGSAPVGGQQSQ